MSIAMPRLPRPMGRLAALLLTTSLALLSGCVLGQVHLENETRVMTVAHVAASPMTVRTVNGAISVAADPAKTEVSISADLHAQTLDRLARTKIVATRDADGALRIEVAWADGQRLNSEGCDFDIVAPDVRGIDVDTSNGAIIVTDLGGNALLKSSNGKITATHQAGDVRAATSNGAIVITDPAGNVKAGSSNGAIEVVNAPGRVDADTSNGRVEVTLSPTSPGPVKADSANGRIRVVVGAAFRGLVSMRTSNSGVKTEGLEGRADAKVIKTGKSSATISFGAAGDESSLTTSNGQITLIARPD